MNYAFYHKLPYNHIVKFKVPLKGELTIKATSSDLSDTMKIKKVETKDPSYTNKTGNSYSWEKVKK